MKNAGNKLQKKGTYFKNEDNEEKFINVLLIKFYLIWKNTYHK